MDDFDIYGDLEKYESEAKKDSAEVQDLLRRIAELEKQLESKEQEKCDIEKKNRILAENISSLLLTAKAELKRKDTIIADLRKQCDNAAFRRGNQGQKPAGGKKREQATQTSVSHSRHTGVQTDLSKTEDGSDRKRKSVREQNGDDDGRESKRARVHEHGSYNRDLDNDRERRREKDRDREKDRYRDREADRVKYRDRERSRERVRERSRERHKSRTSDKDREGMARRERDSIKDSEGSRRSEVTDTKDRNRRERDARARPVNASRDQQAKESVSSDHKTVATNGERKSVSKDGGHSHRSGVERRTHSTKPNTADDVRDSNNSVKTQTAVSDRIPEESSVAVTSVHSDDVGVQQNRKENDETRPDTQNAGKCRNDSSPVAIPASTNCTTLDASEAASPNKPTINEHLITQNNDANAETVSQSVTKNSVQHSPATDIKPKSVTKEPLVLVELAQKEICVEDTPNVLATDYPPIVLREGTEECATKGITKNLDLPETTATNATSDENENLNNLSQAVLPSSPQNCNRDEILTSTIPTSNEKTTPEEDNIVHNTETEPVADAFMVSKSPEAPIAGRAEKDHTMQANQNDSNANAVEGEDAVDQTSATCERQNDTTQGLTELDIVPPENSHSRKLQLPFREPICQFTDLNDGILSSSKYLTKPVNPRIRALIKEAVVFKNALNNLKLASKITEPMDLTEALVAPRRLPSNHAKHRAVQQVPFRKVATHNKPFDGQLNRTNDRLVPSSNSPQLAGAGSNATRQDEASNTRSSNFGNGFLKITSTCTISPSSITRIPVGGAGGVLSFQQMREQSSTTIKGTSQELPRPRESPASASRPIMCRPESNYAVYTPWRNYFKDSNVENETVESNKSPTKRATPVEPVEEQPVTTFPSNPSTNDETRPTYNMANTPTSETRTVDHSSHNEQLTKCSASSSSNREPQLLNDTASSSSKDGNSTTSDTRDLADSSKQPKPPVAVPTNSKRRMSADCLTVDKRHRPVHRTSDSQSVCLSKEFFSPIALPIVSALDFVQPKPRCNTRAKSVLSTPKSKAPAPPPTPMVVLHSPAKSSRTPLKAPPMMESEFDANSSVQHIMDSLLKTPIKTEINDEQEHEGHISGINESMFSNVSAISHDVLNRSYFSSENPLSAVKSEPEEEKTPVKQICETTVDLVSPWHTAVSSTPVTATKTIARIEKAADANVSAVPTDISVNSVQISANNSTAEVCAGEDTVPTQNSTNISSERSETDVRHKRRSAKKKKKKEKNPKTDGHSRRVKRKQQHSVDTSANEPRVQSVPQPAQRDCGTREIIPDECVTIANDIVQTAIATIKATREQQSAEVVSYEAEVPSVTQSITQQTTDRRNLTTERVNVAKSVPSGGANVSASAVGPAVEPATTSGTTDKENVPWVKKESILRTPGQYVTPDGPVNFVREMRVVKESPNYMRVYITRKKV